MKVHRHLGRDVNDGAPRADHDRRSSCRYAVIQDGAWLGWWKGQAFQSTAAKIIDISLRGAMLTVDGLPPKETPLYFRPPGVSPEEDWIEVRPVGSRKRFLGPREVRIIFRHVFPYESFKAVVYGPDALQEFPPPVWHPLDSSEREFW